MNSKVLFYWACSTRFVIFFPNMIIFTCTVTKALWLIDRHSFSFQTGVGNFTFQSAYMSSSWFPKLLEITSSKFAACLQISSVRTFDELVCKPLTVGFCDFSDVTQGCQGLFCLMSCRGSKRRFSATGYSRPKLHHFPPSVQPYCML